MEKIDVKIGEMINREPSGGSAGLKTQLPGCCITVSALDLYGSELKERDVR